MKKTLAIVINVENKQESYYQYIDLFVKCQERNIEKIFTCTGRDSLQCYVPNQDVVTKNDFRVLAKTIEKQIENESLLFMTDLRTELSDINKIILYFRLHMDTGNESEDMAENEIVNLQYYFLIKQYIEQENKKANLSILCELLIDNAVMEKIRFKLSHFLLFELKKESPVFLRNENASEFGNVVNLPGTGEGSKYRFTSLSRFCPLLEISEETYRLLSSPVETVLDRYSDKLGTMPERSLKNYMDDGMNVESILVDMCIFYFIQGSNKEEREKRKNFFRSPEFRNEIKGMTLLSFFILCAFEYYLIELYKESEQEEIELSISDLQKKINMANNLSSGLIQIIENVVAHTKYRRGYFCFRIHRKESDYMKRSYHAYLVQIGEKIQCNMFLEVKVCDLSLDIHKSRYSSIIAERFISNLSERQIAEPELKTIYRDFQNIAVKDFYLADQAKDEYKDVWRRYYAVQKNWLYHYGLKLYARVVKKANGFFEVNSQNGLDKIDKEQYYSTLDINAGEDKHLPGTQYSIVLPYLLESTAQKHIGIDSEIEYDEMLKRLLQGKIVYNHEDIKIHELIQSRIIAETGAGTSYEAEFSNLQTDKEKYTNEVKAIIREEYEKCFTDYADSYDITKAIILDVGNLESSFWQEIVAKAVWIYICDSKRENEFNCALDNCSFEFIQYLTNTIAIYFGLNPEHRISKEYQLYICNAQSEEDFLISGCNLLEIRSRAYKFAVSRGLFPHALTYLFSDFDETKVNIGPNGSSLEVIPFDLLVKKDGEVLFIKLIKSVLEKEIYNPDYGCKLPDIHIRLGSKIHIRNFYEAEILFQDSYFSKRMAYFVVDDIMRKIKDHSSAESKRLVLIGYENYSETFIYDVHKFLKQRLEEENTPYDLENYTICFDINGTLEFVGLDNSVPYEDLEFIIIVSLNSTLTTHNKIKAALEKQKKIRQGSSNIFANYSVMLLRDDYIEKSGSEDYDPTYMTPREIKFWSGIDDINKIVKSRYADKEIKYFISEVTGWNDPLSCSMCFPTGSTVKEQALIDTNKISIIPALQYGLVKKPSEDDCWIATISRRKRNEKIAQKKAEWDREDKDDQKKLEWLADNVKYGHIKRNDNHFLFYFDTKKLFDDCKEELKVWLERNILNELEDSEKKNQSYFGIYNILVTPVHESNTGFIELINDCIFKNAAYIVRFDINKMYRNNLVARYSNLTLLYRRIIETAKEIGGRAKINLYYVDDTIVSGKTFERASSLMKSLYRETQENMKGLCESVEVNIFEGCFLLLNRLSTESIRGLAGENCKYYSYFDIPISLIRNHEDFCFMCNLIENAHQLCIESSTNEIAQRWNNVEERFQLKEYYLFDEDKNKKERYRKRFYATYWSSLELKRLGKDAENIEKVSRMIVDRLLIRHMWGDDGKLKLSDNDRLEVLFSYIKVLSRPFFNSNWRNREVIFSLILIFLDVLLNEDKEKNINFDMEIDYLKGIKGIDKICSLINKHSNVSKKSTIQELILMHNMLMVFVKQAMELNSNYIIRKDNIIRIVKKNREILERLKKIDEKDSCYQRSIKSIENFESIFIIYVKQLISLSGDEKKSIWLEKLLLTGNEYISEKTEKDEEFLKEYGLNSSIGRGLYIENTSAIKEALDDIGREILVDIKNGEKRRRDDTSEEVAPERSLLQMDEIETIIERKLNEIFQSSDRYYLKSFYEILHIHGYAEVVSDKVEGDKVEVSEDCFAMLQQVMKLYVLLTWKRSHTGGLEKFYMDMMICFASILESPKAQCQILMPENKENKEKKGRLKSYCLLEIGKREGASYKLKEGENESLLQGSDIREMIRQEGTLKTFSFISEKYLVLTFESDTANAVGIQRDNIEKPMFLRPLYFVFDISGQKEEDVVKKLRFILTMRTDIVKNLERDFKDNSFQEMIEEKNKKIQLSEWKNATHSAGWIYSDILKSMSENREIKEGLSDEKQEKYVRTLEGAVLRLLSDSNISSKYHAILTEELERRYAVGKKGIKVTSMDFDKCILSLYKDSLKDMPQENKEDIMCKEIHIRKNMCNKKMIYFSAEQEQGMLIIIPILQNALKHCAYEEKVEIYCGDKAEFSMESNPEKKELYYLCIDNPIANVKEVSVEEMLEFIKHPIGMRKLEHSGRKNGISLYAVNKYLERLIEIYYGEKIDFTEPILKVEMKGGYMSVKLPIIVSEE